MGDFDSFAAECKTASKQLRRLPKDLRRALATEVKTEVAVPLAGRIANAATGPYARPLSSAVRARASAEPQIVVGGTRRVVSGGASARQLVFGTEWGGGKKLTSVAATSGHKGYRRRSTRQFAQKHPFVYPTIAKSGEWVLDKFADIVDKVLGGVGNG